MPVSVVGVNISKTGNYTILITVSYKGDECYIPFSTLATPSAVHVFVPSFCSGQQKLATILDFFQYLFSDSFGGNPPLYS
ncbi:hypothetical protein FNI91_22375 [Salmonella enterica subsp. salamae]|nr:hypothetical protein [Salmonella enterica subsp. salamae]